MVEENNFLSLDSAKGEGFLDFAAFRQWDKDRWNPTASIAIVEKEDSREQFYDGLRAEATEMYYHLLPLVEICPHKTRLIRYFQGDRLENIAQSENVTRQAVHKSLKIAIYDLSVGVVKARLIWTWGQTVYSSTAISV